MILYIYPNSKEGQQTENVWKILQGHLLECIFTICKCLQLLDFLKWILVY